MKDIRIFVASSKELAKGRNYLVFLVLSMEEVFAALVRFEFTQEWLHMVQPQFAK